MRMFGVLRGSDVYKDRIKIETGLTRFVSIGSSLHTSTSVNCVKKYFKKTQNRHFWSPHFAKKKIWFQLK